MNKAIKNLEGLIMLLELANLSEDQAAEVEKLTNEYLFKLQEVLWGVNQQKSNNTYILPPEAIKYLKRAFIEE